MTPDREEINFARIHVFFVKKIHSPRVHIHYTLCLGGRSSETAIPNFIIIVSESRRTGCGSISGCYAPDAPFVSNKREAGSLSALATSHRAKPTSRRRYVVPFLWVCSTRHYQHRPVINNTYRSLYIQFCSAQVYKLKSQRTVLIYTSKPYLTGRNYSNKHSIR